MAFKFCAILGQVSFRSRLVFLLKALLLISVVSNFSLNELAFQRMSGFRLNETKQESRTTPKTDSKHLGSLESNVSTLNSSLADWWSNISQGSETMKQAQCESAFGFGLVQNWKAARRIWCSPSVACHTVKQAGHGGNGDSLCVLQNVVFDPSIFNNLSLTRSIIANYNRTKHREAAYIRFDRPVLAGRCSKNATAWRSE